jgi:hypothetical protein
LVMRACFAANGRWRKRQKRLQIYFGTINANNIPPLRCGTQKTIG